MTNSPSESTVHLGSSLPPGVEVQQKGKLTIQVQEVKWQSTASLQSGCSLYINWWGQAAVDNLILVIPNGCCPPAITAVFPLLSSMKQFSRYLQDMGKLELCLVVGKQDRSGGEPGVSLGNFSLEVANLSEDVQIQGSHAVLDKTGVFLAIVSLKLSLSYSLNGADAKGTDWDKSSLLGMSFEDLVAQRLNLLREKGSGEQPSPTLPSAVLKMEDIGRALTAHVRTNPAGATPPKGYDNFGQRKEVIMDFELSRRDRPSSRDSLDSDQFEISPKEQTVLDVEVRTPPKHVTSPKGVDQISQRRQLVVDVGVRSTDRVHSLSPKNVSQVSSRKQLVMDIDVPHVDRGHLQFSFDAASPRIALLEGDLPGEDGSGTIIVPSEQKQEVVSKDTKAIMDSIVSSGTPKGPKFKARSPIIQQSGRSKPSRVKQREIRVTTPSKSRPLSAPAGMKACGNSSRPASQPRVLTRPRSNQQERKGDSPTLNSRTGAARPRPRFVSLPQGKQRQGIKPISSSRRKSPLSDSELSIGRYEGKSSGNRGRAEFSAKLVSSPLKREQISTKDTQDHLQGIKTERLPSPTTQQLGSNSFRKRFMAPLKRKAGPVTPTRAQAPRQSRPDKNRSKSPLKQRPFCPELTTEEELTLDLKEEAKKNCELHSRSPESIQRVPPIIRESIRKAEPKKKAAMRIEPGEECDIHLESEEYAAVVNEQQLKSGWHELAGNLAILSGDEPCSPNMGESRSEIFEAESLQRLIERLEAFQQALQKSSAAHIADSEGNTSLDLSERLRDVDENISSISRHLTRLLPDLHIDHNLADDDKPMFAHPVTLGDEELVGQDVTERNDQELCFQPKENEKPHQCMDAEQLQRLDGSCELHCDRPNEAPQMDIFFLSEKTQNFNQEPENDKEEQKLTGSSRAPLLHDCCEVHSDSQLNRDTSPELNLRLILNVGKLTFEELALTELGIVHTSVELKENAFGSSVVQRSTCLLTVSVPGLVHSDHRGAEQSLSISPVSLGRKEAYFGHESQLNWSGLRRETLKLWVAQTMKVSATMSWEYGDALICEGRVYLARVIDSMPQTYQTKLELRRVTNLDSKSQYTGEPTRTTETAAAKIEIGITLLMEDMSGKPKMMGAWLYLSFHSITGCIPHLKKQGRIGHLHLVARTDREDNHHIPFLIDCSEADGGVKHWRLCKRRHSDAVFRAPNQLDDATLFIEVWQDWRGQDSLRKSASYNFIGLVEVPLATRQPTQLVGRVDPGPDGKGSQGSGKKDLASFHGRVEEMNVVAAEGNFSIWNPIKDVVCGSLQLRVVLGLEAQMLILQQRDRAARIVQSYVRCFTERIRAGKEECVLFAGKHNHFAKQQFSEDYKDGVTRHVLEVTVQHATDLPPNESFRGADSERCEGAFIKYLFPCDGEPFYTQDMRWGRSIFFNASVHHGIILPTSESLETHLMKMTTFSKNDGNLLFELWGCFINDSDNHTYSPNKLRLSDSGEPTSWDMRREKSVNSVEPRKKFLGTCKLSQKNLLHMISEKRRSLYSSPEVRKKFYLPVPMDQSQFQTYKRAPTLVVQVAYFILEIEDRKAHLVDTIFSDTHLREDSLLEATLEIVILKATGLESAVRGVEKNSSATTTHFENGLNSYVRCSLFASNRQLELIYPPAITCIKANDFAPKYRWTGELKIILNVQVLRELRTGNMCFEVWHHSYSHARTKLRPIVLSDESSGTDICLGVATMPSRILLHSKEGVTGWHDLSRKGVVVGSINLAVSFKKWRVRRL
ncbi:unnamed protein product [Calypogeia fissa]